MAKSALKTDYLRLSMAAAQGVHARFMGNVRKILKDNGISVEMLIDTLDRITKNSGVRGLKDDFLMEVFGEETMLDQRNFNRKANFYELVAIVLQVDFNLSVSATQLKIRDFSADPKYTVVPGRGLIPEESRYT